MTHKKTILAGLAISLLALYAAIRKVEWDQFIEVIRNVDVRWIVIALIALSFNLLVRAVRWRSMLRSVDIHLPFWECYHYYMIGYMSNLLFPMKAGEVIRPYLLGRKHRASVSALFSTVIVERIADVVFLASLLMLALFVGVTQIPVEIAHGAAILLAGALGLSMLLRAVARHPGVLRSACMHIPFLRSGRGARLVNSGLHFLSGFAVMIRGAAIWRLAWLSSGMWGLSFLTLFCYLRAFNLFLPWYAPVFMLVILNFGMMLPASPGAIGLAHFLYVYALSLFYVEPSVGLGFAVVAHGVAFVWIVALGLLSAWREGIAWNEIRAKPLA